MDLLLLIWGVLVAGTVIPAGLGRAVPRLVAPVLGVLAMPAMLMLPHLLLLEGVTLLAAALLGAQALPFGPAALAIHGFNLLGLLGLAWRNRRAVLVEEGRALPTGPRTEGWWHNLRLRAPNRRRARRLPRLTWREVDGKRLIMDVWLPREPAGPLPALVFFHGGAFIGGTPLQSWLYCAELAARGFAVFAPSYRLAPRHALPDAIADAKAAVAWVRAHATDYGVDPARIAAVGASAGGHLAGMVGHSAHAPELQPDLPDEDTSVRAIVSFYGVGDVSFAVAVNPHRLWRPFVERVVMQRRYADDPDRYVRCSPKSWARPASPPMLLIHGDQDALVPIKESRRTLRQLREAGAPARLVEVRGAVHAFTVHPSPAALAALDVAAEFLHERLTYSDGPTSDSRPRS